MGLTGTKGGGKGTVRVLLEFGAVGFEVVDPVNRVLGKGMNQVFIRQPATRFQRILIVEGRVCRRD